MAHDPCQLLGPGAGGEVYIVGDWVIELLAFNWLRFPVWAASPRSPWETVARCENCGQRDCLRAGELRPSWWDRPFAVEVRDAFGRSHWLWMASENAP